MKRISYKELSYYIFLLILVFAYWNASNNFFWRDEWSFLEAFKNLKFDVFDSYEGHILPVFKIFYLVELYAFGTVSILYLYVNLFLHFLTSAVLFYFLKNRIQINKGLAFILVGIIVIHPINYNTLLWTFQAAQLLQILFQLLAVVFFISFIEDNRKYNLLLSVFFLVIQNYCFGNGLLMPIPLILGSFFIVNRKLKYQSILLLIAITVVFLSVQILWSASKVNVLFIESARTFLYYNSVNVFRYIFIKNLSALNSYIVLFLAFPLLLLTIKFKVISQNYKLIIYLSWYVCASVLIPVARNSIYLTDFPEYYSFSSFLPFALFVIELFKDDLIKIYENRQSRDYLIILVSFISVLYFFVDRRAVATFSVRNLRNEVNLNKSIVLDTDYYAYDDPYFIDPSKLPAGEKGINRISDPKGTYLFWKQKNNLNFLLPPSISKDSTVE